MGKEVQQKEKEFDVMDNIESGIKISKDHAKEALSRLSKENDEKRILECEKIIAETQYATKRQLLNVRKHSKLEENNKEMMKALCILDKDGNCVGGLLKDALDGKLSKIDFDKKKEEIIRDFRKKNDEIDSLFDENLRKLRSATSDYASYFDWSYRSY